MEDIKIILGGNDMNCTEFKKRVSELVTFSNEAEKRRFSEMSNKRLQGIRYRALKTDNQIREAWRAFNKKEADWERYCRQEAHNERFRKHSHYADFSHLAYNGVADDF